MLMARSTPPLGKVIFVLLRGNRRLPNRAGLCKKHLSLSSRYFLTERGVSSTGLDVAGPIRISILRRLVVGWESLTSASLCQLHLVRLHRLNKDLPINRPGFSEHAEMVEMLLAMFDPWMNNTRSASY